MQENERNLFPHTTQLSMGGRLTLSVNSVVDQKPQRKTVPEAKTRVPAESTTRSFTKRLQTDALGAGHAL